MGTPKRTDRIDFECPGCGKEYQASPDRAGLRLRCKGCGEIVPIPEPPEPVAPEQAEEEPESGRRSRSQIERALVWGGIGLLFSVAIIEWSSRSGYQSTLANIQVPFANDDGELTIEAAGDLVRGWPSRRSGPDWIAYRWFSLVHDYSIVLHTGDDVVLSLDTEVDPATLPTERKKRERVAVAAKPPPQKDEPAPRAAADPVLLEAALTRIGRWRTTSHSGFFRARIREVADHLQELTVGTEPETPAVWNRVELNKWGTRFDCVRFRSPLDVPADLYWCFGQNQLYSWNIAALDPKEEVGGFRNYSRLYSAQFEGAELPITNVVICQELTGGRILPGRDYVIWFDMAHDNPVRGSIALHLLPAGTHPASNDPRAIARIVGARPLVPPFEANATGLARAMRHNGHFHTNYSIFDPEFDRALQSVATVLPEVEANREVPVTIGERGSRFAAVRIRNPSDEPADLVATVTSGAPIRWGLVPESPIGDPVELADIAARAGLDPDAPNALTTFATTTGRSLAPGGEYLLWFGSYDDEPVTADVKLAFDSESQSTDEGTLAAVRRTLEIDVPDEIPVEQVAETLEWMGRLSETNRSLASIVGLGLLESLPELEVGHGDVPPGVHSSPFPEDGHVVATRFRSPQENPGDLYFAGQIPGSCSIYLTDPRGATISLGEFKTLADRGFQGRERLPETFVTGTTLPGGTIEPNRDYLLWARTPEPGAGSFEWAISVEDEGAKPPGLSIDTIADAMLMPLEPEQPAPGSEIVGRLVGRATGVGFTPDGRTVVTAGEYGELRAWDLSDDDRDFRVIEKYEGSLSGLHVLNDELVAVAAGSTIEVVRLSDGKFVRKIGSPDEVVLRAAFSADGSRVATVVERDGLQHVVVENVDGGGRRDQQLVGSIRALALSPDGSTVVTSGIAGRTVGTLFWNADTLELKASDTETVTTFGDMRFSADGRRLAGTSTLGVVVLWDGETFERAYSLSQSGAPGRSNLSPDGKYIAVLSAKGASGIWSVAERRLVIPFRGHHGTVHRAIPSPDGRRFVTAGEDGTIRLWDVEHREDHPAGELVTNSLGMTLVPIASGTFWQGAVDGDTAAEGKEKPRHEVTISKPFLLGRTEVTVGQFRAFVEATEHETTPESSGEGAAELIRTGQFENRADLTWRTPGFVQTDDHPVVCIGHEDAEAFCKWLSEKEGVVYRLPTEAEWEYASRCGNDGLVYGTGSNAPLVRFLGNVADRSAGFGVGDGARNLNGWDDGFARTAPVSSFAATPWGLDDMHGNVWEYTADWHDEQAYQYATKIDPRGPADGQIRVARGGSFAHVGSWTRCSERGYAGAANTTGFRVVREVAAP